MIPFLRVISLTIINLTLFTPWLAFAQVEVDSVRSDSLIAVGSLPIRVGARAAFELQAGMEEMTLAERVEAINRRIARARIGGGTIPERRIVSQDSSRWEIRLGDSLIMIVGPNDSALAGITADSLSNEWLTGLQSAMASEERTRTIQSVAWKVGIGLLFPILLWVVFNLLGMIWRRIEEKVEAAIMHGTSGVHIRGFALIDAKTMGTLLPTLVRVFKGLSYVAVIYIGIVLFFSLFPQTRPMGNRMLTAVLAPIVQIGSGALDFMPFVIAALVVTLVVRFALRVIDFILDRIDQGFVPQAARAHRLLLALKHVIRPVIIAAAVLLILSYTPGRGATLVDYAAIGLLILVIIGFWRPFESVIADVILSYVRPFQVGDRISINEITGTVTVQSAFFLRIRDEEGRTHVIPKRRLMDTDFTNEGRQSDLVLVRIGIQAAVARPVDEVEEICKSAAEQSEAFEKDINVRIADLDLKNDIVFYEITGRVRGPVAEAVKSNVYRQVLKALQSGSQVR